MEISNGDKPSIRKDFLPFALPDTDGTELEEVTDTIRSGWLTTGPKTKRFENEFAAAVGARHAVAVNSCTAAMHLALESIGLRSGDEVITTPYTFAATAEVVRYFNARPVFVDINPSTLQLDPERIEGAVTARTRTILPVHIAGLPAELDAIHAVAGQHGIPVIEDAAHAFPTKYHDKMIGALSTVTCFSFYVTKTLTTGEGGMICTQDEALADRCQIMALHGISRDAWKRYTAEGSWYYEIVAPGFKYNMTDVAASLGLAQLRKAERMWARRRKIAQRYQEAFGEIPELETPPDPSDCQHAWHLYMLRLNLERLKVDRAKFIEELKKLNIGTSVHFIPLHLHPYYCQTYGYSPDDFPCAFREYQREISLPIYSKMSDEDVNDVIEAVKYLVRMFRVRKVVAVALLQLIAPRENASQAGGVGLGHPRNR
jgi:dTDP-4-amino-4,6-dideoxygalactose transaminase